MMRLIPTGRCWCPCEVEVPIGSFFLAGHDKRAVARVITEVFGTTPHFLHRMGYAPPETGSRTGDDRNTTLRAVEAGNIASALNALVQMNLLPSDTAARILAIHALLQP